MNSKHVPVLLQEVLSGLQLSEGMTVVDATLGGAGYSQEICKQLGDSGMLVALDADASAVVSGQKILCDLPCTKHVLEYNFRQIKDALTHVGVAGVDGVVFDLGISSLQLDGSGRGFSFQRDEPLLMTFSERPGDNDLTARYVVNQWSEQALSDVFYGYGEEKLSRKIARGIVEAREKKPIETTRELVEAIESVVSKRGRIHPATRVFQSLRIVVNGELQALEEGLAGAFSVLRSGGRMAVVSFHSLEDRLVKRFFREKEDNGEAERITKKPIVPTEQEIKDNPRSRSAKLRILKKT